MWNYDKTLDIYRYEDNPNYYVDTEVNKVMPGWKKFYLCDEREDLSWKMISTDVQAALDEAANLIERLTGANVEEDSDEGSDSRPQS